VLGVADTVVDEEQVATFVVCTFCTETSVYESQVSKVWSEVTVAVLTTGVPVSNCGRSCRVALMRRVQPLGRVAGDTSVNVIVWLGIVAAPSTAVTVGAAWATPLPLSSA